MRELTEKLKSRFKSYYYDDLNEAFIDACKDGNLEIIRYLLTSPDLKRHADIHVHNDAGFQWSCRHGHIDVVRYLLTSPELTEHADIHAKNDLGFQWSCLNGHLDVAQYLLTSSELTDHADIHADDDLGFIWACQYDHLDIVQYLLSFGDNLYIDFQKMGYNLYWAMENYYHDIVKSMIASLYKNNMMAYVESISKAEEYCLEHGLDFTSWQGEMMKEDAVVNPKEEVLFL